MTNKRKKPSTNKIKIKRVGHGKDLISTKNFNPNDSVVTPTHVNTGIGVHTMQ